MGYITGFIERNMIADDILLNKMDVSLQHRVKDFNPRHFIYKLNGMDVGISSLLYSSPHEYLSVYIDGTIFNSDSLKEKFKIKTSDIPSCSDADLILSLYEKFGLDSFLDKVDGAFSACIVDRRSSCVYLIRDKIGEKPLYYYKINENIVFSSEIKALYHYPGFKAVINNDAVSEYFVFRYVSGGDTFLKNVYEVKPGTYIRCSLDKLYEAEYQKNNIDFEFDDLSFEDVVSKFDNLLDVSVRRRLSNVKFLGAQLSGGIDSSYLCYVTSKLMGKSFKTFSISQGNKDFSEEKYSDFVTKKISVDNFKNLFTPADIKKYWMATTFHFEAPINHAGTIAILSLNKKAAESVSVIFNGDGPDEMMGGYDRFYDAQRKIIQWNQKNIFKKIMYCIRQKGRYSSVLDEYFINKSRFINNETLKSLRPLCHRDDILKSLKKRLSLMNELGSKFGNHGLHRYLNYEIYTYGYDVLVRSEKMASAFAIEARSPYLMSDIVDFLQHVNDKFLVDGTVGDSNHGTKMILKSLCSKIYGPQFTFRFKEGLGMSLYDVFLDESVKEFVEKVLFPGISTRGIVDFNFISEIWAKIHKEGVNNYQYLQAIWCACSFEIWAQMFIDSDPNEFCQQIKTIRNE